MSAIPFHKTSTRASEACSACSLSDTVVEASKVAKSLNRQNKQTIGLAQLRLTNLHLHGREEQLNLLRTKLRELIANNTTATAGEHGKEKESIKSIRRYSSLDSITSDGGEAVGNNELLLVAGSSGQGKSALVIKGIKDPAQKMGITFAMGKFDLNSNTVTLTFSALVDAFRSLTKQISCGDDNCTLKRIKLNICEVLGEEDMHLVSNCLPGCEELFTNANDATTPDDTHTSAHTMQNDTCRLQYAFCRLLRAICSNLKGVVLFQDDLQWSDSASLELIKSLALARIPNLLLVGAYRDDEVQE